MEYSYWSFITAQYDENGELIPKETEEEPQKAPSPPPAKELSPEALALKKELDRIFVVAPDLKEYVPMIQ